MGGWCSKTESACNWHVRLCGLRRRPPLSKASHAERCTDHSYTRRSLALRLIHRSSPSRSAAAAARPVYRRLPKRAESSCRLVLASATDRVFVAVSSRGQAVAALGSISAGASRALGGPRGLQPRAKRPARGHRRLVGAAAAASVLLLRRAWGGGRADGARRRSNPAARLVRSTP